jgi:hypothetical protein
MSVNDADLIEVAQGFRDGILDGRASDFACAMICYPLAGYLSALHGIECEVLETKAVRANYGTCNHVWLRLPDGRVLDPSADQFNVRGRKRMPPVYLGPPTALHRTTTDPAK